jgi:hypothetical protein
MPKAMKKLKEFKMKNTLLSALSLALITLGASQTALANPTADSWKIEKQRWEQSVPNMSQLELVVKWTQNFTGTLVACGASSAVAGSALVADTVPVGNILTEILANFADEDYVSLSSEGYIGDSLSGIFAGGGALVRDGVQFVLLAMTGDTDQAWKNVKKSYQSSIVISEKLFQDYSLCNRLATVELILRKEIISRARGDNGTVETEPQPLVAPTLLQP